MGLRIVWRNGWAYAHGTVAGQSIRQSLGTRDERQAEEARALLEARLWKRGQHGDEAVRTFEEAALAYLEAGGEARYMAPLLRFFRGRALASIKPGHIEESARKLYPSGSAATRRRQAITPAVAVINHAHGLGWCPLIRVRGERIKTPPRKAVDRAYIDALRARCLSRPYPAKHLAALMLFLHTTGARIGEALALTPADLDLDACTATAWQTKNGHARVIVMPGDVAAEVAALPVREGRVFGYSNPRSVYKALHIICAEAGLEYLGTHQPGRHSFATALNDAGMTQAEIMKAGNWRSTAMVARYTHADGAAARAARIMERKKEAEE